jgi:hypothetical protein
MSTNRRDASPRINADHTLEKKLLNFFPNSFDGPITPNETAWLFNLSPSVISEAIAKGQLEKKWGGNDRNTKVKYLFVSDVIAWRLKLVCPHLFKPLARMLSYDYTMEPNDYRPPKRSAPKASEVMKWWTCDSPDCDGHGQDFPMTPSSRPPRYCPFCGQGSAIHRANPPAM